MLLSFSVGNFRSFREEQTLSLLASKRLGPVKASPSCHRVPGTEEHAIRVASLYGANGAGKSNLVRSLRLLKRLVLHGTLPGKIISYDPFLLDEESPTKPTSIELQFVEQGSVFRYGVSYDAERVHEEWLDMYEGTKERGLFSRVTSEEGTVSVELGPVAADSKRTSKICALAAVGARPNQLFLTEVVNLDDPKSQGRHFEQAIHWFRTTLNIIEPDSSFQLLVRRLVSDDEFAKFAGRFLREASTGIAGLEVRTTKPASLKDLVFSPDVVESLAKDLAPGTPLVLPGVAGGEIVIERGNNTVKYRRIIALHDSIEERQRSLPFQEESDGSQRLLHLLPALYQLTREGGLFVIDELERSMHPMLARKFVEFFLRAAPAANSQLIFTTHESTLLDLELVRRDGIWFAEKNREGVTHLYSLADFKVRKDLKIDKGYLQGRFGAIPFLGGVDHLIEEKAAEAAR